MNGINRRHVLKTTAAGAAALGLFSIRTRPAEAAEFTYKLGTAWPSAHPSSVEAKATWDRIKEATGGRVEIGFFPNNMLGGDATCSRRPSARLDHFCRPECSDISPGHVDQQFRLRFQRLR